MSNVHYFLCFNVLLTRNNKPAPASAEPTDIPLIVFDKPDSENLLPQAGNVDTAPSGQKPASSTSLGPRERHQYWHKDCRDGVKSKLTTQRGKSYIIYFCKKEKRGATKILKKVPV